MKFARYLALGGEPRPALVVDEVVFDLRTILEDHVVDARAVSEPQAVPQEFLDLAEFSEDKQRDICDEATGLGRSSTWAVGPMDATHLLAPVVRPSKILCVGLNYRDHIDELGVGEMSHPRIFSKLPNALCGPQDLIKYPSMVTSSVDYEVELAVVIGKPAKTITADSAIDHVLGYSVANDVSARDWQFGPSHDLTLGKGFDNFFPLGPQIVTPSEFEPNAKIRCWVNGDLRQETTLSLMVFGIAEVLAHISKACTLFVGDIVSMGTPAGVGYTRDPPTFLEAGDVVVSEIEGIGQLVNRVEPSKSEGVAVAQR